MVNLGLQTNHGVRSEIREIFRVPCFTNLVKKEDYLNSLTRLHYAYILFTQVISDIFLLCFIAMYHKYGQNRYVLQYSVPYE